MFGFFSPLPIAAPLLVTAATASGTASITLGDTTLVGVATVPVVAQGSITLGGTTVAGAGDATRGALLMRRIPPRNLLTQALLRRRR